MREQRLNGATVKLLVKKQVIFSQYSKTFVLWALQNRETETLGPIVTPAVGYMDLDKM